MKHTAIAAVVLAVAPAAALAQDGTSLTWGGYVKMDAIYSQFSDGPVNSDTGRDFYVPGVIPVSTGSGESSSYLDMHAKESRLYLKGDTVVEGQKIGAYMEVDFIVNPGSADERIANAYNPGLRRVFVTYNDWTMGQDWSTFHILTNLPESLDFVGWPSDGTVFMRQGLVRYSKGGFAVSLENPTTTLTLADGTRSEVDQSTVPDLAARYSFTVGKAQFAVAGLVRQLSADGAAGVEDDILGFGGTLTGKIPFSSGTDIRFGFNGGEGIGRYLAINTVNDAMINADAELEAITAYNGFVSLHHQWTAKLRSNLTVSALEADHDTDLVGTGVTKSVQNGSINLLYSPVKPLTFGVEYRHATREVESGADGDLDRIQVSAKYMFSRTN